MSMDYTELLKRAKESLPKGAKDERWDIPKVDASITGKRTLIRNFDDIAKSLRRKPEHIAKYLFKELAVPGSLGSGQLILQGKFTADKINNRIAEYVKEFVLCSECNKPDTTMVKKDRLWFIRCEACGASRPARHL